MAMHYFFREKAPSSGVRQKAITKTRDSSLLALKKIRDAAAGSIPYLNHVCSAVAAAAAAMDGV